MSNVTEPKEPVGALRWLWLSGLALVLDQATKIWASQSLELYDSVPVTQFFNIVLVHNYGAAFSFLSDAGGWQRWFFTIVAVVVSGVLVYMLAKLPKSQILNAAAYSLILGGALGNVIDRIYYGYVIDFIDWYVADYHWPAFNIADSAITLGVGFLIWDMIREGMGRKQDV